MKHFIRLSDDVFVNVNSIAKIEFFESRDHNLTARIHYLCCKTSHSENDENESSLFYEDFFGEDYEALKLRFLALKEPES